MDFNSKLKENLNGGNLTWNYWLGILKPNVEWAETLSQGTLYKGYTVHCYWPHWRHARHPRMAYPHVTDSRLPLKCGAVQILEHKLWVWEHSIMYVNYSVSLL